MIATYITSYLHVVVIQDGSIDKNLSKLAQSSFSIHALHTTSVVPEMTACDDNGCLSFDRTSVWLQITYCNLIEVCNRKLLHDGMDEARTVP